MQKLIKLFSEEELLKNQALRFKQLLYIYLFTRACFWLTQYNLLFGKYYFVYSSFRGIGGFKDLAFILLNSHSEMISFYFIIVLMLACVLALLFEKFRIILDVVIWLLVINLHYKIYSTLTGGDFLINQLLFFNIFLAISKNSFTKKLEFLINLFHNGSVISIVVQVCLVYFLSGLAKLINSDWQKGEAITIIAQIDQFKLISLPYQNKASHLFLIFLNYLVLVYQLFFPLIVFIRKIKKVVLTIGIAMHLYIMLFMGLFWFGLIMIITYVFFWPFNNSK